MKLKENILKLRKEGKSYRQIESVLNCSRATISYHCNNAKCNEPVSVRNIPTPNIDNENIIRYLVETGTSRKIIADALRIPYKNLVLFCKRKDIVKGKILTHYAKVKQHRRNKKILAVLYKGGKCASCGYSKSFAALEFHHENPKEKDFTLSKNPNVSWVKMKKEIDKCKLLCANCHREEHDHWIDQAPIKDY